eukprot:CAMPEP_0116041832 /NCGR_PEP_ID=MMETSP0321-20121206/25309_1 /TAXON_ID=163516 /ORGANISM="Leptocylindrus danicus var. danicus, Strain B650" /LENGTH=438 /DNA_ID=CAMNT_0003522153 /DNA_START=173 /DNA_END=1489 /DNA_ORIENTATION=-
MMCLCDTAQLVDKLELPINNLTGDLGEIGEPIFSGIDTLSILDLDTNFLTGNMSIISTTLSTLREIKSIDLRANELTGTVSVENWCKANETYTEEEVKKNPSLLNNFEPKLWVDCNVNCACCPSNLQCEYCVNEPGWVDLYGDGCDWYEDDPERCSRDSFKDYVDTNFATRGCCECGGGTRFYNETDPSAAPSRSPINDEYAMQREVLLELFDALNGTYWNHNRGWREERIFCDWTGVKCDDDQQEKVTQLRLEQNDMSGTIPSEIGLLKYLKIIDFRLNSIRGTLPTEIGNLSNLVLLSLRSNDLTGSIPTELGLCKSLKELYVYRNEFTGQMPNEVCELKHVPSRAPFPVGSPVGFPVGSPVVSPKARPNAGSGDGLNDVWADCDKLDGCKSSKPGVGNGDCCDVCCDESNDNSTAASCVFPESGFLNKKEVSKHP